MIDLNELEQGDTVLYGKTKCVVNHIRKIDAFKFLVVLYKPTTNNILTAHYDCNGENLIGGCDIVEIIKNPKRWTDDDLRTAYLAGINKVADHLENRKKQVKHEQ